MCVPCSGNVDNEDSAYLPSYTERCDIILTEAILISLKCKKSVINMVFIEWSLLRCYKFIHLL